VNLADRTIQSFACRRFPYPPTGIRSHLEHGVAEDGNALIPPFLGSLCRTQHRQSLIALKPSNHSVDIACQLREYRVPPHCSRNLLMADATAADRDGVNTLCVRGSHVDGIGCTVSSFVVSTARGYETIGCLKEERC